MLGSASEDWPTSLPRAAAGHRLTSIAALDICACEPVHPHARLDAMAPDEVRFVEFEDDALPAILKWQVLSFLRVVWSEGFRDELRHRDWITNPAYRADHLLHVAGNLVVSHLEIVEHQVDRDGTVYTAAAPTGVLTFPSFRGEGWAGRLVRHAARRIEVSDADVGLICCRPESAEFYARNSGWDLMPGAQVIVGASREQAQPTRQVVLARPLSATAQKKDWGRLDQCTLWLRDEL